MVITAVMNGPAAAEETLIGRARVVDGDTLEIEGRHIRLHGIDALESRQSCRTFAGEEWPCGQQAALRLATYIGDAPIRCEARGRDRNRRTIAVCWRGSQDLGGWLVANGWALAFRRYSQDYVADEDRARDARQGIWAGSFEPPWEWRGSRHGG